MHLCYHLHLKDVCKRIFKWDWALFKIVNWCEQGVWAKNAVRYRF